MAKTEAIILSLLFVITVSCTVVNGFGTLVGGKADIPDVKTNKEVQEIGKFAVEEFNRSHQGGLRGSGGMSTLVFSQVVEAQKQVVNGIKYFLKIETTQQGLTKTFESEVVVKPWEHSQELLNFSPSPQ